MTTASYVDVIPVGRVTEVICQQHQDDIIKTMTWPRGMILGRGSQCPDCRILAARAGGLHFAAFDKREHDIWQLAAEHEAGHALAALLTGCDQVTVTMEPRNPQAWVTGKAGARFLPNSKLAGAVALWAGTIAHQEGLRRRSLFTRENAIGCVYGAKTDQTLLYQKVTPAVSVEAKAVARDLVAETWDTIQWLAGLILDNHHLTGADIISALGKRP